MCNGKLLQKVPSESLAYPPPPKLSEPFRSHIQCAPSDIILEFSQPKINFIGTCEKITSSYTFKFTFITHNSPFRQYLKGLIPLKEQAKSLRSPSLVIRKPHCVFELEIY